MRENIVETFFGVQEHVGYFSTKNENCIIKIFKNQRTIKIENGIEAKISINPFAMKDLQQITYKSGDWAKTVADKRPKD
jgi:hypothetical protein